ncbi:flagellar hook-associated protein FlgK [Agrobacterium sp. ES01]|uniref:flagellar hook-associated protein FlgK n=1 Tax=Agrobacterium sp. ES01 TaxID=3420714 RepID=UPI003D1033CA
MTLTSAINSAKNVFSNTGEQSAVISKNIANSSDPNYVKRTTVSYGTLSGSTQVSTERATNGLLQSQMFMAQSESSGQQTLVDGLEQLKSVLGGNEYELSPSTYLSKFYDSLQNFATKPGEVAMAQTAISAAGDVVNSLNTATKAVQDLREQADQDISDSVTDLNALLSQLETLNNKVISITTVGGDPSDALDLRDGVISDISQIVGINVQTRDKGDVVLYTTDGTTLFETIPRTVTFTPQTFYDAGVSGNPVMVDGTRVNIGVGGDTSAQGSIAAQLQIRDEIAPVFQSQLDEVARGLITIFSETDPSLVNPDEPGLFTWSGGTSLTAGTIEPGLAGTIAVSTAVQSSAGGDPMLLRDGGINGAAYIHNTGGAAGYTDQLNDFLDGMTGDMIFDAAAQIDDNTSLMSFSTSSVGWLEEYRSGASNGAETKTAMLLRAEEAYSNKTGVSLDEELSLLLDVEQSYKAATKLLNAVDEMLQSLLAVAG